MAILCIDIGGTAIKYNVFSNDGEPIEPTKEVPTSVDHEAQTNHILDQVFELIDYYSATIEGVAIASAGVVDPVKGEIAYAGATIPEYKGTNFKDAIREKYDLPCSVENDVSCMGYAERWRGQAKDAASAICLTLGTGIGGAVFIDGEMWHGVHYTAGEVGYLPIQGHDWQDIASATALVKFYRELTGKTDVNGKDVLDAYDQNAPDAVTAVECLTANISEGLLAMSYLFNPERIVIGGGIMARADILLPMIKDKMAEAAENAVFLPGEVLASDLSKSANLYGAFYHYIKERQRELERGK